MIKLRTRNLHPSSSSTHSHSAYSSACSAVITSTCPLHRQEVRERHERRLPDGGGARFAPVLAQQREADPRHLTPAMVNVPRLVNGTERVPMGVSTSTSPLAR